MIDSLSKILSKVTRLPLVMVLAFGGAPIGQIAAAQDARSSAEDTFAMIDGERISQSEFKDFIARYARSRNFHRMTKERLVAIRRDAANAFVERRLLAREAIRRGVKPDTEAVDRKIAAYESKYKKTDAWPKVKPQLPQLRQRMLESSKIAALEKEIRYVDDPGGDALAEYYKRNIERFTEPAQDHLAVILIPVPPSAPRAGWEEAHRNADKLRALLQSGSRFADIARQHSKHKSASAGGDLGFVHKGVLTAPAQKAVDNLKVGEISQPVRVLEGFVILQLVGRKLPEKRDFADVRDRVRALYVREGSSRKWRDFLTDLRKKADVVILDSDTPDRMK